MTQAFQIPIRIYIEDTDAGGIVYYVNYLKFMERARTEFMRSLGYGKAALSDRSLDSGAEAIDTMFVVHSLSIDYKKPALLDDLIKVTAKPEQLKRTSMVFLQQIWRDEELLIQAEVKIASVSQALLKPEKMPADMHQKVSQYLKANDLNNK